MYIKKTRSERKKEEAEKRNALRDYRRIQYRRAIERDDGKCVFCWFIHQRIREAVDVHHVFGRANKNGKDLWKEEYTSLLCTCRECHPLPIKIEGGSSQLSYVEDVLVQATNFPINKNFRKL